MKRSHWKTGQLLSYLLVLLVIFLVFREHAQEILQNLRGVPLWGAALLFGLALAYQGLEAAVCRRLIRTRIPDFSFPPAFTTTFLGVFGNVATCGAGSIPMQGCYLCQYGLLPGQGIGIMTAEYIFHKTSTLIYAAVMLLFQGSWLRGASPDLFRYLVMGFGICGAIITALVLLCTWERLKALALRAMDLLPDAGKWGPRKAAWRTNLEALHTEARYVLKSPGCCLRVLLLNGAKLFCLYLAAYLSFYFLNISSPAFWRVQLLTALMLVITGALPNVAGVGPTELAFLLIFSPYAGDAAASSALILYRTATYFFPFLFSCFVLLHTQRKRTVREDRQPLQDGPE
ncbi:MAG: flippase-like domain-containing protein [Oscillospiraceae bacterium]|nr:flippase-like domain-containing protein [Oscillospiraceae bacterium]